MENMTPDRNVIARASALGWKSKHLGDEADADAAFDWLCEWAGKAGKADEVHAKVIDRAASVGWSNCELGSELDCYAALDWLCRNLESVRGWWGAALRQRDAAQDREKLLRESLRVANDLLKGLDCVTVDLIPEAEPVGEGPNER